MSSALMLLEFPFLCPLIAQRSPRLTFTVRRVLQRRAHSTAAPHHARTTSQPQPLSATPTTIKIPIQSSSQDHLKRSRPDPFLLVEPELSKLRQTLLQLLGSSHSSLTDIASYYFTLGGKQLRPLLVLLVSQATNGWASGFAEKLLAPENSLAKKDELDRPLSHPNILNDWNPRIPDHTASFSTVFSLSLPERFSPPPPPSPILTHQNEPYTSNLILPTQLRLAQISEMIHVASLLHDDVLDGASLRRSSPSAPFKFGNKLSVLGGDFLLGRASASLSRLGEPEVTELVSSIISNLVEGEVMQLREVDEEGKDKDLRADKGRWLAYLQKSYFKTASLMAKTARSAVVLGGARKDVEEDEKLKDVAYAYGRNIGIAFQLVDDALDFSTAEELGKPGSGTDLRLGLATAPTLYAWETHEEMGPLVQRRFKGEGDVEMARSLVLSSGALDRTRALAQEYANKACEVLDLLPETEAREALVVLAERVVERKK